MFLLANLLASTEEKIEQNRIKKHKKGKTAYGNINTKVHEKHNLG